MNVRLWSVLILGLAVTGGVIAWHFIPRRERLKRFENRPELSWEQIYGEFFAGKNLPKALALELWSEVANSLGLPPGKLRPADRFDIELAPPTGWEFDDDFVVVYWAAERRLKRLGLRVEHSNVQTLADYVEFFCKLVERGCQSEPK